MLPKIVRPDAKGRITLGHSLTKDVSGYLVTETDDHRIILEPQVEIPAHEKWLFDNKSALEKVKRGLNDATGGKFLKQDSFSKFVDDDIE